MAAWVLPLALASLAVLLLNGALLAQRARERSKDWPAQFLRDLRRWDGLLPDNVHDTSPRNHAV
jgi:uncharacterized membrane protein YhaH (DUF805 family)